MPYDVLNFTLSAITCSKLTYKWVLFEDVICCFCTKTIQPNSEAYLEPNRTSIGNEWVNLITETCQIESFR